MRKEENFPSSSFFFFRSKIVWTHERRVGNVHNGVGSKVLEAAGNAPFGIGLC